MNFTYWVQKIDIFSYLPYRVYATMGSFAFARDSYSPKEIEPTTHEQYFVPTKQGYKEARKRFRQFKRAMENEGHSFSLLVDTDVDDDETISDRLVSYKLIKANLDD